MTKFIDLAKKLKALADKGVGGEKQNASEMLEALMRKHGINPEDLESEKRNEYFFDITEDQIPLFNQFVKTTNVKLNLYVLKNKSEAKKMGGGVLVECTASEYVEIESKAAIYFRLFKEEYAVFFRAFLTANDLLVSDPNNFKLLSDLTEKEREDFMRAQELSRKIKSEAYRKQLK